nr:wall-associated receptor kinase 2-like [Coffea arabica]
MKFAQVILFILMVSLKPAITPAAAYPYLRIAKDGCSDTCGNIKIPYPFGMTKDCYLKSNFSVTCNHSYNPPKLFLQDSHVNVTKISLEGQLNILKFVARKCPDQPESDHEPSFRFPEFTINSTVNKFTAVGCDTYGFLQSFHSVKGTAVDQTIGCITMCFNPSAVVNGSSSGGGCCQTSIPQGMTNFELKAESYYSHRYVKEFSPCSFAFVVEEGKFNFTFDNLTNLRGVDKLPMVLDWGIGDENQTCETERKDSTTYACQQNTYCVNGKGNYRGYRCFCNEGYEGNPYLPNTGCQDIDECQKEETNNCKFKKLCKNVEGGYNCSCPMGYLQKDDGKGSEGCIPKPKKSYQALVAGILEGVAVGTMVLLMVCSWCLYVSKKRKMMWLKEKFFRENGGLLLQKRLNGQEESSNAPRIFSGRDLEKATNNFHDGNIIGQGGFGIVYKGRLIDNKEVAIKKSKTVDPNQIEQFINEVVILSQINHKNVVKLFGCCLETEVPLLVYEFINNDTLFNHLHNKKRACGISWDIRLKIGAETAEALSYLHSAASPPIIHRDIKTTNILLDEEFTAKVSDFGASRLGLLDQDQLSTVVQGTRGYLDPEFFQTFQLTEKSDVYSFGVVLVELLTGKKPVCFNRSEGEISLSNHFLSSMKENRLFQILEDSVASDENIDQLRQVAVLAERCLNVKGADRPSMKEVAMELVGLRITLKHTWTQGSQALNQEEIEPLIDHQEQSNPSGGGDIILTTTYYSLQNHEIQPIAHGR